MFILIFIICFYIQCDFIPCDKLIASFMQGKIADEVGAFFMMDMTHILGFVAESVLADPFEFCDIVATATLKVCFDIGFSLHFLLKMK